MPQRTVVKFQGEADGITTDMVLEKVIAETPQNVEARVPAEAA